MVAEFERLNRCLLGIDFRAGPIRLGDTGLERWPKSP